MLKSKTVFIIGAGAGVDYNLPVGKNLAQIISGKLNIRFDWDRITHGDAQIADQLRRNFRENFDSYQTAAWQIRDGISLVNSIDDYIDINNEDEKIKTCGKVAIVKSILESERHSSLHIEPHSDRSSLNISSLDNTWLVKFFKLLIRSSKVETAFDNVAFVNFNYDRCLEHFFFNSLKALFRLSDDEASSVTSKIKIFHPYGSVGAIRHSFQQQGGIVFGQKDVDLITLSKGIKTYTEKLEEGETETVRKLVCDAETLVFLGFGFHEQNIKLITSRQGCKASRILATAFGISRDDTIVVHNYIADMFKDGRERVRRNTNGMVKIRNDLDCSTFLDQYHLTLAN